MWLIESAIVSIVLVLLLVILWSGISFPGFIRSLNLGLQGRTVFWGIIFLFLGSVIGGFVWVYAKINDPMVRGFALVAIPMFLGIPFRMVVGLTTRNWILIKFSERMIRPATNNDVPVVTQLIYEVLEEYGLPPHPDSTDADLKDLEGNYMMNHGSFDVLLNENSDIIGTIGILRLDEGKCELRKMYLKAEERGRGYGKLLLEHGLRKAKDLGYTRVILETASVLKEAITLYRKYGFERFEMENPSSRCDQMYFKDI